MIQGNKKTKDYIIARNVLTEPGMIYNENLIKDILDKPCDHKAFEKLLSFNFESF